jgi:hypothetical protein
MRHPVPNILFQLLTDPSTETSLVQAGLLVETGRSPPELVQAWFRLLLAVSVCHFWLIA